MGTSSVLKVAENVVHSDLGLHGWKENATNDYVMLLGICVHLLVGVHNNLLNTCESRVYYCQNI